MRPTTHDLFDSIDSFCARNPDDPMAFGWVAPIDRPPPLVSGSELIDFDAPPSIVDEPTGQVAAGSRDEGSRPAALCQKDAVPLLMTTDEAAAYLNVKSRLIRRMVADKRLKVTKVARFNRFAAADLDQVKRHPDNSPVTNARPLPGKTHRSPPAEPMDDPIARVLERSRTSDPSVTTTSNK